MTSPYSDLDRPALSETALQRALMGAGGFVSALRVLPEVDSTNTALMAAAQEGAPHASVVVAEVQTAGKGRLGRTWQAPARSGLFLSILVRPEQVPPAQWGWLPLLAGVAARSAVAGLAKLDVSLKWPNDLILATDKDADSADADSPYGAGRKLGGILVERVPGTAPAAVIGIGLNVTLRAAELPAPHATSLALAGAAATDREPLLRALLRSFGTWYGDWADADGDAGRSGLLGAYRAACSTIGREVRAELPGGTSVGGLATGVDEQGRLLIRTPDGAESPITAGDLVHLR